MLSVVGLAVLILGSQAAGLVSAMEQIANDDGGSTGGVAGGSLPAAGTAGSTRVPSGTFKVELGINAVDVICGQELKHAPLSKFRTQQTLADRQQPPLNCAGGVCPEMFSCTNSGSGGGGSAAENSALDQEVLACNNPLVLDFNLHSQHGNKFVKFLHWGMSDPCPADAGGWMLPNTVISPRCRSLRTWGQRPAELVESEEEEYNSYKGNTHWLSQVHVLHNVFVNRDGVVFNRTHFFDYGGCQPNRDFTLYLKSGKILTREVAVNFLHSHQGQSAAHREIVEKLPLFFSLAPLMQQLKGVPFLMHSRSKALHLLSLSLLGLDLGDPSVGIPVTMLREEDTFIFAKTLYQPFFQTCDFPSPALWTALRATHLLPPDGLPIFKPDFSIRGSNGQLGGANWTAGLPSDWLVLISRKGVEEGLPQFELIKSFLESYFTKERVVVYSNSLNVIEARALFNRAALFLTASSFGLTNIMFMPTNSTVVNLHSPLKVQPVATGPPATSAEAVQRLRHDSLATVVLMRNFAEACGVKHYVLTCAKEEKRGEESLFCDMELFKELVDKAAGAIFLSSAARKAAAPASGGFDNAIPGSRLKTRAEVEAFKSWMGCISREGSWQYDPTPRILPWNHDGSHNLCDYRHEEAGGITVYKADAVVKRGGSASEWRVRESLKYDWKIPDDSCAYESGVGGESWKKFEPREFCSKVGKGRTLLLLGDSLTHQMLLTLVSNILRDVPKPADWAVTMTIPEECTSWLESPPKHAYCSEHVFHEDVCPAFHLRFVRNDGLWIDGNPHAFDHMPWMRHSLLHDVDMIVMNRGAHYRGNDVFEEELSETLNYIRNRYPEKLVIFRNTPPGHFECEKHDRPIQTRQDPKLLPYHWDAFAGQNKFAAAVAEKNGIVLMDVDTMTALRPDSHKGWVKERKKMDCLHYCTPGPIDLWVQQLYNILLRLV